MGSSKVSRLAWRSAGAAITVRLSQLLEVQADRWFLWIPVCFGAGAGGYFSLMSEPSGALIATAVLAALIGFIMSRRRGSFVLILLSGAILWTALGIANAKLRTYRQATPTLPYATGLVKISGWLQSVERRQGARQRFTLSVIQIERLPRDRWPERLRLSLSSRIELPPSGSAIVVRARLRPLPDPVAPGNFDFARKAWFDGLGAVGYALGPPEMMDDPPPAPIILRLSTQIDQWRRAVSARIRRALPDQSGDLAAALISGDRGAIPETTLEALRHSGLAHVLAISGMHMAMFAGSLFWLVRAGLAAMPALALRYPIKKWAALIALLGAAFYLTLSGASIATQRAFLMISIIFAAMLLDRPALTLRNVALAALLILALYPESVVNVSFQMSFAAVVALVAVYEAQGPRFAARHSSSFAMRAVVQGWRYLGAVALTTLVAGIAVAPYAAFHFHKLAQFGLLANLLAMPLFALLVMPMALLSLLAMPLGLESLPLRLMSWGIEQMVDVATWVSGLDGAVIYLAAMPVATLVLLSFGGLWLCLWRGGARSVGLLIALAGLFVAIDVQRPDILIDRDGENVAIRNPEGRLRLPEPAKKTFSVERWLLADGDSTKVDQALAGKFYVCDQIACLARIDDLEVAIIRHPAAIAEECARADVVISNGPAIGKCSRARVMIDRRDLYERGAHALYIDGGSIIVRSVAELRGERPWVTTKSRRNAKEAGAPADPVRADAGSLLQ